MVVAKAYIEQRSGALYVADTRVSLASVVYQFRRGASPDEILENFPALRSLENVYGAIAFFLANQSEVEEYLQSQELSWDAFRASSDPLPPSITLPRTSR